MPDAGNEKLLGRLAVHYKLITLDQLAEVTREQGRSGESRRFGDILVEKGFLTQEKLQKLLAVQRKVVAQQAAERAVAEAAAVPEGVVPAPRAPAPAAQPEPTRAAEAPAARAAGPAQDPACRVQLHALLAETVRAGASDLHLHSGAPRRVRIHGVLEERGDTRLAPDETLSMILAILTQEQRALFEAHGELDFAYTLSSVGRFRVNAYRQQRGADAVFRSIPAAPPTLPDLGLPSLLAKLTTYHQGMVLITGPAGCGKSSTLSALVNLINEERSEHILTIEDPIECLHPTKRCLVNQRQVRSHTESFARALRGALREDPDVIAIGELRDLETVSLALSAAETGHFVLATLHTSSAIRTIDRVIGVYPPDQQGQIRTMLSESLRAVVSQRLVRKADGSGRVPALEILMVNKAVGNLIREAKTFQIRSILQTGSSQGMCLLDGSLAELLRAGTITKEEARRHCEDPKRFL